MKKKLFSRAGLALAIGASLMVMAGVAQAVVPAGPPVARAAKPVLVAPTLQIDADALYQEGLSTTGFTGTLPTRMFFTAPHDTTVPANWALVSPGTDGLLVNAANNLATNTTACIATDDICVYAGTAGVGTQTNLRVPTASLIWTTNAAVSATATTATAAFDIVTAGTEALRVNSSTGVLEYTANKTAVGGPTWQAVSVTVQVPAAGVTLNAINASDSSGAINVTATSTPIAAIAAQSAFNSLPPTPVASTTAAPGAFVINGLAVDTITPISAFANVTNFTVRPRAGTCAPSTSPNQTATDFVAADATGAAGAAVAPTATAPGSAKNTIVITAATASTAPDWTTGPAAADVAAANSTNCFNTGVTGAGAVGTTGLPFVVNAGTAAPTYTLVFATADGAAVPFTIPGAGALSAAALDGAAPAVVSATTTSATDTTSLILTFSEPMVISGGAAGALREVAENILLGSDSLAALNLNAGGVLGPIAVATTAGQQGTLTIPGVQASDVTGKTLTVNTGIALVEPNDARFIAAVAAGTTTAILDVFNAGPGANIIGPNGVNLTGGLWAATGGVSITQAIAAPSTTTALTIAAAPVTIVFGDNIDTTAVAFPTVADPTKIGTIVVTFATGKEVALGGTHTLADLATNLVVTVNGLAGNDPRQFQFHPTAAQLTLSVSGNTLIIQLPTALIYANIDVVEKIDVEYLAAGVTAAVLVDKLTGLIPVTLAGAAAPGTPGTQVVQLPLTAVATSDTLITQSIIGTLTSTVDPAGSRVMAFLAKWVEKPTKPNQQSVNSLLSGNVVNANDRVGTTLAIEFLDAGPLQAAIQKMMNSATAAAPAIPGVSVAVPAVTATPTTVYVKLIRSNDPTANASGASTTGQVFLEGRALMASTYAVAKAAAGSGDNLDPIYEVSLSPPNIFLQPASGTDGRANVPVTGRLTGNIVITFSTNTNPGGLEFIGQDGRLRATAGAAGPVGQAIVGTVNGVANSYNLLLGVDPGNPTDIGGTNTIGGPGGGFPDTNLTPGTNFGAITSANAFVILVHEQPGTTSSTFTMLTSADPSAANFVPFKPNLLTGLGVRTTLASVLANIKHLIVVPSTNWALYGEGFPARQAVPAGQTWSFPRGFVGMDGTGVPKSFWTNDGDQGDMAMTMSNNKILVATEIQPQGTTLSTINSGFGVNGSVAFGWSNDAPGVTGDELNVLQSTNAVTPKVLPGWTLVTVPAGGAFNTTTVNAIIRVGAQLDVTGTPQQTWIQATDGTPPVLTPGEAVFVFSKAGGNL